MSSHYERGLSSLDPPPPHRLPAPLNVRPNKSQQNEIVLFRPEARNCERVHVIATF